MILTYCAYAEGGRGYFKMLISKQEAFLFYDGLQDEIVPGRILWNTLFY